MNKTAKDILKNSLSAAIGLIFFALGVYFTIQANIGVSPWDTFELGLASTLGITYGTASIIVSIIIILIDVLMHEKIGIGMFLDAFLVGKSVDLFNYLNLIPIQDNIVISLILMVLGLFLMGFSQFFYMRAGLGCGPRDTLLVGMARRMIKIPIGAVSIALLAVVTFFGWLLGGPIGIGTLICAFCVGPSMQLSFKIVHFKPTTVEHQDIITSAKIIFNKKHG